jgi:hypothetical protein
MINLMALRATIGVYCAVFMDRISTERSRKLERGLKKRGVDGDSTIAKVVPCVNYKRA